MITGVECAMPRLPGAMLTLRLSKRLISVRWHCIRLQSTGKGSFPLDLPRDFAFTPHSIVYSNGHQTIPSASSNSIPVQNPATEEIIQSIDCASPETVTSSITDAQRVFDSGVWSRADPTNRFHVLNNVASLLRLHSKELAARNFLIII